MKNKLFQLLVIFISICIIWVLHYWKDSEELKKSYSIGLHLYEKGDIGKAERQFLGIQKKRKGFMETNFYLGKINYYNKNYQKSYELFKSFWEENPNHLISLEWLIKSAFILKINSFELNQYCNLYLNQNPHNPEILYLYGLVHESEGKYDLAITHYEKAIQTSNSMLLSLNRLNTIYRKSGLSDQNQELESIIKALKKWKFKKEGDNS